MVHVNGVPVPIRQADGLLVLEDAEGNQSWTLVEHATANFGDDMAFVGGEEPRLELQIALPPGHALRMATTLEAGEENVLVYSRLLVHVLREERERYAELEKAHDQQRRLKQRAEAALTDAEREHAEGLHEAWRDGARSGYGCAMAEQSLTDLLERNPHSEPEDDETDGCHVCGGPDH